MDSMDRKLEAEARARLEGSRHRAMSRADELEARIAELEAEREKLRAVVLAVAEAFEARARPVGPGPVGLLTDLFDAVDSAIGIHGTTWRQSAAALRALAGSAS